MIPDDPETPLEPEPALALAIAAAPWRHTDYQGSPHEYVVAAWSPACALVHRRVVELVRSRPVHREHRGRTWPYTLVGRYRYWTIGAVCNRVPID